MKKILLSAILLTGSYVKAQDTLSVQQKITSTYDSYNVIVLLNAKTPPLSAKDSLTKVRNVQHINYMLAKAWFYTALTTEQKNELNNIVE